MGLGELRAEILKKTFEEVKRIDSEAQAEEKSLLAKAAEEREKRLASLKAEVQAELQAERGERISAARLRAKRMVEDAKESALNSALMSAWELFRQFPQRPEYQERLKAWIHEAVQALGNSHTVVRLSPQDKKHVKLKGLTIEEAEIDGGVIASSHDGRIIVSRTLRDVFEEQREWLRRRLHENLFGGGK